LASGSGHSLPLVIVRNSDIVCISSIEPEANAPLVIDPYRHLAGTGPFQLFEMI
jgi:hypothetical protein